MNRLVLIADFLDKEGLVEEANYIDKLLKKQAEPEVKNEVEEDKIEEDKIEEEVDEEAQIQSDVMELGKIKKRFAEKFYKSLLKAHSKIRNTLKDDTFGYLGDERREILKVSFAALINAIEAEFRTFSVTASLRQAKKVDNSKVIKHVYKVFNPILDLYEQFERFMASYPEFAQKFPRTQSSFLTLKNVINNIIRSIPEEILDMDLTKK